LQSQKLMAFLRLSLAALKRTEERGNNFLCIRLTGSSFVRLVQDMDFDTTASMIKISCVPAIVSAVPNLF
jgi:hypothetical protein